MPARAREKSKETKQADFKSGLDKKGMLVNHVDAWVSTFDPATPEKVREAIKKALRKEVEDPKKQVIKDPYSTFLPENVKDLPKDMTVAIVMTEAYFMRGIFNSLKAAGIANRYVLIGYSSGLHANRKFSNGESMAGNIFTPSEDLELLKEHSGAPLLVIDFTVHTGVTYAAISTSFSQRLGYTGQMYKLDDNRVVPIDGQVTDEARGIQTNVPILTEKTKRK